MITKLLKQRKRLDKDFDVDKWDCKFVSGEKPWMNYNTGNYIKPELLDEYYEHLNEFKHMNMVKKVMKTG